MRRLRIGLFGFGRTGRLAAAEVIKDPHLSLRWVVRRSTKRRGEYASRVLGLAGNSGRIVPLAKALKPGFLAAHRVDVIIDFSDASAIGHYGEDAARLGVRIVTAVSAYDEEQLAGLRRLGERTSVLQSPNITVGINVLLVLAQLLRRVFPDADAEIVEEHFRDKREVSGTALRMAGLLGLDPQRQVNSVRVGAIVGNHQVIFGMRNQTLRLSHESVTRSAFGRGAIYAAKWVARAPRGVFRMEEVVRDDFVRNLQALGDDDHAARRTGA
jgi:4-hydroxy-tetrahydrodipicolinate reductase